MAKLTGMEALEKKIEKAQNDVVKSKQKYDVTVSILSDLMDKTDAIEKEQLITAIIKSDKTYEDVLSFLNKSNK